MGDEKIILNVENLHVHFRLGGGLFSRRNVVRAVENVSFALNRGETLSIVGESGSGKSTLARAVLRLVPITKGSVVLNGENLAELSNDEVRKRRQNMQMVFQDPIASLSPRRTVEQIIAEPLMVHYPNLSGEERAAKVRETMDAIGLLPDMRNRYPHEFSGGQAQRIGIARALIVEPDLLVADEPVSALDVSIQAQVLNLLSEIKSQRSLSLLFISHDLSVVQHVSDHLLVLYLGHVMEVGPAAKIYANPQNPYTRALLSAVPTIDFSGNKPKRTRLTGELPSPTVEHKGCPFASRCPKAQAVCSQQKPQLTQLEGRDVACHFPG
ncbi:MAG: ABC transporter ATP-binding protein [Alphaproteobacteria bacterium]